PLDLGQALEQQLTIAVFGPLLADFIPPVLHDCVRCNIPIIGNFGAANPPAAAQLIKKIAHDLGLTDIKIAVIEGDDIASTVDIENAPIWEGDGSIAVGNTDLISANAYVGARTVTDAWQAGADVVGGGRL